YLILVRQEFVKKGEAHIRWIIMGIGMILMASTGLLPTDKEREEKTLNKNQKRIEKHLKKRYNEEFKIGILRGGRTGSSSWANGIIDPKRVVGTTKEYDSYYKAYGFVNNGLVGDDYGKILIKEGANEYYGSKLKELFGENVLPILKVKGMSSEVYSYEIPDYKKYKEEGNSTSLEGVFIIFGRVESIADREKYREGIYKFIQYLKEKKSFDNSDIKFRVLDERMLSKEFNENEEDKKTLKSFKGFFRKNLRKKIYSKYSESFKNTTKEYKKQFLDNVSRTDSRNELYESTLLDTRIYGPEYIVNFGLDKASRKGGAEKIKYYTSKDDIELLGAEGDIETM
ncbi:MAG: hypothetical protein ACRC6K_07605, partial [Fusobacteriaceae bacterium]